MRLHRFYIGQESPTQIMDENLIHQWRNVFRMKEGDPAILFGDDGIERTSTLAAIDKKSASWNIDSSAPGRRAKRELILAAALIKKDNFDLIIRQATEIGVTRIIPIISERSEKKGLNMERAHRILVEASEQCGRVDIPMIDEPAELEGMLDSLDQNLVVTGFDPRADMIRPTSLSDMTNALVVGPEGGWTEKELEMIKVRGQVYSLPTFILRAETAATVVLALACSGMHLYEIKNEQP